VEKKTKKNKSSLGQYTWIQTLTSQSKKMT